MLKTIRKLIFLLSSITVFCFISCSTEKNTLLTVAYHNMTAHYNIHFNGYESYFKGINKIQESYEFDYSQILPVYLVPSESMVGSITPDMDRTQKKAMKVIDMHSIKAKREYKSSSLSTKQREYLMKNEYNKWVDNSYMLIGKSYFYQLSFSLALETFKFVLREFENEPVTYDAKIWMAMAYIEQKNYPEAYEILNEIDGIKKMEDKQKAEMNAVFAQYYIKQQDISNAIIRLNKALKKPANKKDKIRYTFILAQLNQINGNNKKAYQLYEKVIKMNPPYEMTFNAKINMAGSFDKGFANSNEIREQLRKMLKDDKNLDFRDQIYYAIGSLYLKDGEKKEAIDNFKFSAAYSVDNQKQKSRTYITLADLYYEQPDYINAQAYYDSAFTILDVEYPDYEIIGAKSKNLTELVENIKAVHFQDSVQHLATLPNKEMLEVIDEIIADLEKKEKELMLEEQNRMQDLQMVRSMNSSGTSDASKTGGWYFYNTTSKSYGQKEFKAKWGNRKLEDHWRRSDKSKMTTEHHSTPSEQGEIKNGNKKELSKKNREYYIQNIPLTDSAMNVSHNIIKEALVNVGLIYKNQFNETELSIEAFEELIKRYPDDEITLNAYYNLLVIYRPTNPSKSDYYKNIILSKYPNSKFAKALTDPEYYKELEKQEKEGPLLYEQTYNLFKKEQYGQVINNANYALSKFKDPELTKMFRYLKTLSVGKTSDVATFRKALNEFINNAENGNLILSAQQVLYYIDNENPEIKQEQEEEKALEIYKLNPDIEHLLVISLPSAKEIEQLIFNIINFNLDNYEKLNLSVEKQDLDVSVKLIVIKPFKNQMSLIPYYKNLKENESVFKDVNRNGLNLFYISVENFKTLLQDKNLERFMLFFQGNL